MGLKLIVENPGLSNSLPKLGLSEKIDEIKDSLAGIKRGIDILYSGILHGAISPSDFLGKSILKKEVYSRIPPPLEKMFENWYVGDYENPDPEEFEILRVIISLELAKYSFKKELTLRRMPHRLVKEEIFANFFCLALTANYPHPADFNQEYQQFRQWKMESIGDPNGMLTKALDYWLDCLWLYGAYDQYFQKLTQSKEVILALGRESLEQAGKVKEQIEKLLV